MKKIFLNLIIAGFATAMVGCETEDDNKLEQARACLDKNQDAAAAVCTEILAGVNGAEADLLRVKIKFATKGFIRNLTEQIGNNLDQVVGSLIDTTVDEAALTLNQAIASGNTGMIVVARLSYIATLCSSEGTGADAAGVTSGCTDIVNGVGGATAGQKTELATQALALKDDVCASPSDRTSTDANNLCYRMTNALGANADAAQAISDYLSGGGH